MHHQMRVTPPLHAGLKANQCNFLECEAVQALKALEPTEPTSYRFLQVTHHPNQHPGSTDSEAKVLTVL